MKVPKVHNSAYPKNIVENMQHTRFLLMLLTILANRQTVKSHEFTPSHQADIDANTIHS